MQVAKGIGDKLYEKRKHAALEVEQVSQTGPMHVSHGWHDCETASKGSMANKQLP